MIVNKVHCGGWGESSITNYIHWVLNFCSNCANWLVRVCMRIRVLRISNLGKTLIIDRFCFCLFLWVLWVINNSKIITICNQFSMLSFNCHLTSLKVENATGREQRFISTCQLPNNLRELTLSDCFLTSNDISEIGRLVPHLELLKIYWCYVPSKCECDRQSTNGTQSLYR